MTILSDSLPERKHLQLASDINTMTVSGRLTRPPRYATSGTGIAYLNFTVACNEDVYDPRSRKWEPSATFFDCIAFADLAEEMNAMQLTTGTKVIVTGHLRMEPRMVPGTDIIYKYPTVVVSSYDAAVPRQQPWKAGIWKNRTDR